MPISAVDAINPAFQHAKRQLFQPFRMGQWTKLAFVGFLAGELGSGGGCNFRVPYTPHRDPGSRNLLALPSVFSMHNLMAHAALLTALIVLALVVSVAFMYLSSVMRFILFDSVIEKECAIGRAWRRRHGIGLRYFFWQFLFMLATGVIFTILIGIPLAIAFAMGWLQSPKDHILPLVLGGIVVFFVFFAAIVCVLLVTVLTKDFVIPQMALENIGAFEAWRRLWLKMKQEKGGYAGYIGMKIVMAIGAGIVTTVITFIFFFIMFIFGASLGLAAILGGGAAGLTWNLYTISLAVIAVSIAVMTMLFIMSLLSVPFIVFFPAYSIYFFAARYPPLAAVLYPAPAMPPAAIPPPPETPPPYLPPSPEPIG